MTTSHKKDTGSQSVLSSVGRRLTTKKVAAPIASLATTAVVGVGIAFSSPAAPLAEQATDSTDSALMSLAADLGATRSEPVSRSSSRDAAQSVAESGSLRKLSEAELIRDPKNTRRALRDADDVRWTTAPLNVYADAAEKAKLLGEIESGKKVTATGRSLFGRDEIVFNDKSRWVTRGYLSKEKPVELAGVGGTCTNGTSTTGGANVQKVHNGVCAVFPEIRTYGGLRGGGGDHSRGRAVDIMVSGERGWQVARYVRANAGTLGVTYVIHAQKIWSVDRSGEGWRAMSDRGSVTANHYDHVHVSVY